MKKQTRFHFLLPVLLILLLLISLPVSAEETSGTLSTGQTWNFDAATGTLTVTGTGELPEYPYSSSLEDQAPWKVWADSIKTVILSEGITNTGKCTFHLLKNLTQIRLPSTLTTIGENAFSDAINLKDISIPNRVTIIGDAAFKNCKALASITIPEDVKTIGIQAFNGCDALVSVTIPKNVTLLNSHAFGNCKHLQIVTIEGAPKLAAEPFSNTFALKQIRFGSDFPQYQWDTLRGIAVECYYPKNNATWNAAQLQNFGSGCTWIPHEDPANIPFSENSGKCGSSATWSYANGTLTISGSGTVDAVWWKHHAQSIQHLIVEDGITNIIHSACFGYSNLKTVKIADSVTIIEHSAFERCTNLTSIDLPKNLESIETNAFFYCSSLQKVTMGDKVTAIYDFAFSNTAIAQITLSNSLVSLGVSVFSGCENLTEIHFPPSLKKMGEYVFNNCPKLESVYFHGDLPEVANFKYSNTHCMIYHHPDNKTWAKENHPTCSGSIRILSYATSTSCGDQHTYGDWVVTVEPTAYVDVGWKERVCTICGHKQSVAIPVDEDAPMIPDTSDPATPPTTTPPVTAPATGSSAPPTTEPASTPDTVPNTSQATQPNTSQPAASAPTSSDSIPSSTTDNAEKSDPTVLIVCIVLGVVLISGVAVWYFLRKKK